MTFESPLWQQANTYSARLDRQLIGSIFDGGVVDRDAGGLAVTQRGAGANFTVDVAPGICVVPGTSISNQGSYLCASTAIENITVPPAPGSNSRIDLVVARVRDSQITGVDDDFVIEVVEGTAAGAPVAPAVPDDAIALAQILVASTDPSVTNSMITDVRGEARDTAIMDELRGEIADRISVTKATRTSGNITVTNTLSDLDASLDLTVPAVAGDELGLSAIGKWGQEPFQGLLTMFTRVDDVNINDISPGGVPCWAGLVYAGTSSLANIQTFGGEWFYTVQAGDIDEGQVTFRLRGSAPSDKILHATTGSPLRVQAVNYGQ